MCGTHRGYLKKILIEPCKNKKGRNLDLSCSINHAIIKSSFTPWSSATDPLSLVTMPCLVIIGMAVKVSIREHSIGRVWWKWPNHSSPHNPAHWLPYFHELTEFRHCSLLWRLMTFAMGQTH